MKYDYDRLKEENAYRFNETTRSKAQKDDMLEGDRILHERIDNLERALAKEKSDLKKAI